MAGLSKKWKESEIERLRTEFAEIDKDKNGLIDSNELLELLKRHFGDHADEKEIRSVMPTLTGADDFIDFEEFVNYLTTDTALRFDVRFIRHMRQKWEDYLGLQMYIPFLALFIFFLLTGKGLGPSYWQTFALNDKVMGEEFETSDELRFEKFYADIANDEEFWMWVEGPLLAAFWQAEDGDNEEEVTATKFVQYANMPIGAMKFKQLRAEPEGCGESRKRFFENSMSDLNTTVGYGDPVLTARQRLEQIPRECVPDWPSAANEKRSYTVQEVPTDPNDPFSPLTKMYFNRSMTDQETWDLVGAAFEYRDCTAPALNGSTAMFLQGKAGTYGCAGHALIIPFNWNLKKVKQALNSLKEGITVFGWKDLSTNQIVNASEGRKLKWIDGQTRGLSVELFTYNQNIHLFSRLQYLVEVTAGGAWIAVYQNINFPLFQWNSHPFAYFFFMFLFFVYIVFYFATWCLELWARSTEWMVDRRRKGFFSRVRALWVSFFYSFWTIFDFFNYVFFFTVWGLRFVGMGYGKTSTPVLESDWFPDEYETVAQSTQILAYLDSINGLLCVGRIFYFLRLNSRFNVLTKTVEEASVELAGLLFIFFVLFFGFCLMGFVVFGHVIEDYRDLGNVIGTLLRYLVGDFDYEKLREERRTFAPIFFTLFQVLVFFLLLNMVIAVLSDAFAKVQNEKWKPALLEALLKNTDDDAYEPVRGQTGNFITDSALYRELSYWTKLFILHVQNLVRSGEEWQKEYDRLLAENRDRNPRLFWQHQETMMVERKSCVAFTDKLNLCPLAIEDYLIDGDEVDEEEEQGFVGFGDDFELVTRMLVFEPAEKMERDPQDLLLEMMESHHYWYQEVREVAEFGNPEEMEEENEEKAQLLKDLEQADHKAAYNYDEPEDDLDEEQEEKREEELKEDVKLLQEANERRQEQIRATNDIMSRIRRITSNKASLQDVIYRAVASALESRMVRQKVLVRFEQGVTCRLHVHRLLRARYGRYMIDIAGLDSERIAERIVSVEHNGRRIEVKVRRGGSESALIDSIREQLGIPARVEVTFKDRKGELSYLTYDDVRDGEIYTCTVGTTEVPDWSEGVWPKIEEGEETNQGPRPGIWRTSVAEHTVIKMLQDMVSANNGVIKLKVEDTTLARGGILEDDVLSESTQTLSTEHEYPVGHIETVECFNQLEIMYEPVTVFREHLETKLVELVRKQLPNLMLRTLKTEQLMALLTMKIHREGVRTVSNTAPHTEA